MIPFFHSRKELRYGVRWSGYGEKFCQNPKALMTKATIDLGTMIERAELKYGPGRNLTIYRYPIESWKRVTHRNLGSCYTMQLWKNLPTNLPIQQVVIKFKKPTKMFITSPGTFKYSTVTGRTRIDFEGNGIDKNMAIDYEIFKSLNTEKSPCKSGLSYNQNECIDGLIFKESMEKLNCTWPFLENNDNICKDEAATKLAFEIGMKHLTTEDVNCPAPCTTLKLNYNINERKTNLSFIKMKFTENVKVVQSYYVYSGVSLIAEIGGYVGLFLGYSVNQIVDLIDYISLFLKRKTLAMDNNTP